MIWRYRLIDPDEQGREDLLRQLRSIFGDILLQVGGDAEEALGHLKRIGERHGFWNRGVSFEEFQRWLENQGEIRQGSAGFQLTSRGEQRIRQESLEAVFGDLSSDATGDHRSGGAGEGLERLPETRAWSYGDPAHLIDAHQTLKNALSRTGLDGFGVTEEDLEVYETEHHTSCATVLLIDISHSMILYGEDRITPAKRVALALCELIQTRYPKDSLAVVTFGDDAQEIPLHRLPYIEVGPFHTNTRAALRMAQGLLRKQRHANRQIFMITDGKPSALTERDGEIYKNPFGLDRRIVAKTLDEAGACRRNGIPVTTFMLTQDPVLVDFVEEFTAANQGRAYYTGLGRLGTHLFVDYVRNRRRSVR